jgi:putative hydrolase of the HAD superfamily
MADMLNDFPCKRFSGEERMNVVFDLGGVVVRWQPDVLIASVFDEPEVRARVRREIIDHADWLALDRGVLAKGEALTRGAQRTGLSAQAVADFLDRVPPALTPGPETVALMRRVRAHGHRLYCLSNMQHASIEHLERAHDYWDVFDGAVISSRINLIKPEPAIYAHLLETFGLRGDETVFIDDTAVNLPPAQAFGIRTIRFEDPAQCERELRALGCVG